MVGRRSRRSSPPRPPEHPQPEGNRSQHGRNHLQFEDPEVSYVPVGRKTATIPRWSPGPPPAGHPFERTGRIERHQGEERVDEGTRLITTAALSRIW